ncbi:WxL domain-containing protein [Vagococcus silagei]|uniref:WxL domain-containing protein n=1 Tax=Vagococcus silagei TaxID=2508885 RepID=A0A4S3B6Q2_9ENTE|nr:hypothetical protein [Vagococcus silagei]THB62328.1 hypothetical protein ESZ54_00510 [Vagococcus silagei]
MKKISGFFKTILFVGVMLMVSLVAYGEVGHADLLQDRINEYTNRTGTEKFSKVNLGYKAMQPVLLGPEGTQEKFSFNIGNKDKPNASGNATVANVSYYKGSDLITSIWNNGSAYYGGAHFLNTNGSLEEIKINSDATFLVNESTSSIVLLQAIKNNNYVFEMLMTPDEYSVGIKTGMTIWNATETNQNIGVFYKHDTALAGDDGVPVRSSGANRGMYIEHSGVKLNYSFQKFRTNPTNFIGRHWSSGAFFKFKPDAIDGVGRESRVAYPNDQVGDVIYSAADNTGGGKVDSEMVTKRKPVSIKPKEGNNITFTTGLGMSSTNPEIIPDLEEYEVEEGKVAKVDGIWFDIETPNGQSGKYTATWANGEIPTQTYTKNDQQGPFVFNIPTAGVAPGKHLINFEIVDSKGNKGYAKASLNILPNMKIEQMNKIDSSLINTVLTNVFGRKDEAYTVNLPAVTPDNQYLVDLSTPNYNKATGKLTGNWTEAEVIAGKKAVNYFPAPTFTVQTPVADIIEDQANVELKGTWKDLTNSKGKIEIKKGEEIIGTYNYPANTGTGNWSIVIPKEKFTVGENKITVNMNHEYSTVNIPSVELSINRQKRVRINYYLGKPEGQESLLPENILGGLVRQVDKRIGDVVNVEARPFLEGQKYKFDPIRSGITSGFTVTKTVTADLNEVKVYYALNQVPVEIQYINIETGKAIFNGLNSVDRKPAKPLGLQIVGTDVNTLIQAGDKAANGYTFHSIKVKKGNTDVQNGQVGDEPTVISILFTPKFNIEPPQLDFGEHKLSIFDSTKSLKGNPEVKITNTRETAAGKITPWKVTGEFSGFKIGTQNKLASELKFGDASFNDGNEVTIESVATPTEGEKKIPLNSKMKLNVNGGGTIIGEYKGTMTWTLNDVL